MKKLLIFDAYGTLISTGKGSIEATREILALQEKEISADEFYKEWKRYHRKHMDESNASIFMTEAEIFKKDLKKLYEQYQIDRPYSEDVKIMLDSLVGRNVFSEVTEAVADLRKKYRVVIGSTTDTEPLLINLENNGLVVDAVYTSEMIKKYKPDKRFYQYILQQEECEAGEAVFIGDSLIDDIMGPQSIGITSVLVDRNDKYSLVEDIKPDYIIKKIGEKTC